MAPKNKTNSISTSLKRSILEKNTSQLRIIHEACDHDFELQTLVISTIENHKDAKIRASANNLLQAMAAEKKEKKAQKDSGKLVEAKRFDEPPEGTLRRGQLYYKGWGPELVLSAILFCEPKLRHLTLKDHLVLKLRGKDLLEFAYGVKCGMAPDRVATESIPDLFKRMKSIYVENGSRLGTMADALVNNTLSWAGSGFYSIAVNGPATDAEVTICNRLTAQSTVIPKNIAADDAQNIAKSKVANNYSMIDASVTTDVDTYQ